MMRARVEQLAARVRLALVVVEEDARAAVQLRDDDALGAVDDERTGLRHQRDLAEVDLLLLDVAHDALAALAGVVDHELGRHLDRRRERHAALAALVDVVLRLLEVVGDEHELARAVEVLDREDAAEHRLEADLRRARAGGRSTAGTCRSSIFWMSMRFGNLDDRRDTDRGSCGCRKFDWTLDAIGVTASRTTARTDADGIGAIGASEHCARRGSDRPSRASIRGITLVRTHRCPEARRTSHSANIDGQARLT